MEIFEAFFEGFLLKRYEFFKIKRSFHNAINTEMKNNMEKFKTDILITFPFKSIFSENAKERSKFKHFYTRMLT